MVLEKPDGIIERAERFRNGLCEQDELLAVLGKAQLFSRAPERPGVLVHRFPNRVGEWVAAFSGPEMRP